jgi:hypothetical protein
MLALFLSVTAKIRFWAGAPRSLPTKTSFGPDGKKQLSRPTNDLQKLFLESLNLREEGVYLAPVGSLTSMRSRALTET